MVTESVMKITFFQNSLFLPWTVFRSNWAPNIGWKMKFTVQIRV